MGRTRGLQVDLDVLFRIEQFGLRAGPGKMGIEPKKSSCPRMTQIDADEVPNPRSSASFAGTFCLSRSFTKWVRRVTSPSSMFADICVGIGGSTAEYRLNGE